MALGHLAPGSRGRCVRPNNLAALVEGARRRRRRRRRRKVYSKEEEEEEEGLFKADAVNEEEVGCLHQMTEGCGLSQAFVRQGKGAPQLSHHQVLYSQSSHHQVLNSHV